MCFSVADEFRDCLKQFQSAASGRKWVWEAFSKFFKKVIITNAAFIIQLIKNGSMSFNIGSISSNIIETLLL